MWRNLLQVLAHELNHLKQQHCDRHLNCAALACRCNLSLFSDVGPLETIAENKKEQKSAAKRDVQDFLPDFLTGFLLLNRSGLDAHERANILAAIRGEFWVKTVEKLSENNGEMMICPSEIASSSMPTSFLTKEKNQKMRS